MKKSVLLLDLLLFPLVIGCGTSQNNNPQKPGEQNNETDNPNIVNPDNNEDSTSPNPDENHEDSTGPNHGDLEEKEIAPLTIYSLNDTHGDLLRDPDIENFGIDGAYYLMNETTKNNGYVDPIFICTGDMFQGQYVSNTTRGRAIIDALNYMNIEAFVLGNHEFDWGLDKIKEYKDGKLDNGELNCDILCANLIYKPTNSRPDWVKPYTIIEREDHKIGVIGFMGEELESSILAEMIENYEFIETSDLAEKYARELREEKGCDTVIIGIHDYDFQTNLDFANLKTPIDGIFGGHTHTFDLDDFDRRSDGKTIFSIQSGANNEGFSVMHFEYNKDKTLLSAEAYPVNNNNSGVTIDFDLKNLIEEKYAKEIRDANEIISQNFPQKNRREWGRYVAESLIGEFSEGADVALINKGGIRNQTVYKHNSNKLYFKQLYRVLPFDNKIYQVKIKKSLLDTLLKSNNKYHYWAKKANDINKDYYILNVIDYVFDGAYNRNVWNNAEMIKTFDLNIRDYVVKTIKGA